MHTFHATYSIEKDQATVKNLVLFPGQYQTTTSNENLHLVVAVQRKNVKYLIKITSDKISIITEYLKPAEQFFVL